MFGRLYSYRDVQSRPDKPLSQWVMFYQCDNMCLYVRQNDGMPCMAQVKSNVTTQMNRCS